MKKRVAWEAGSHQACEVKGIQEVQAYLQPNASNDGSTIKK